MYSRLNKFRLKNKLKKDKRGVVEESLSFLIIAGITAFLLAISFAILAQGVKQDSSDFKKLTAPSDEEFITSFLSLNYQKGTMYDLLMKSYLDSDFREFDIITKQLLDKMFDNSCYTLYMNEIKQSGDNCKKPSIDSEIVYPMYGKNIKVRLIVS